MVNREEVALDDFYKVGIESFIGISSRICEKPLPHLTQVDYEKIWDSIQVIKAPWLEAGGTLDTIHDYLTYEVASLFSAVIVIRDEKLGGDYCTDVRFEDFCMVINHLIAIFSRFSPTHGEIVKRFKEERDT